MPSRHSRSRTELELVLVKKNQFCCLATLLRIFLFTFLNGQANKNVNGKRFITPQAQRERGKVIGRGVHININIQPFSMEYRYILNPR